MGDDRGWAGGGIGPDAFALLARTLPASRLWSLLLAVFEQRAAQRDAASLLDQWTRDGFVRPSYVDQRTLVALDGHLLAAAGDFESLELAPVAPLGVCSAVALASQNKVLSALRGTEVVADPTNVLALECARRLRRDPGRPVRLATSHRCVRAQPTPRQPGFAPHFRLFCLATAGLEQPDHAFTEAALRQHVGTMMRALDRLEEHGYAFGRRAISVFSTEARTVLGDRVAAALGGAPVRRASLEHPYYNGGLRFQISVTAGDGAELPLVDGGTFDWVARLASNRRLVFVATGMGSQLAALLCRAPRAANAP